jgi:hypothetical protein
MMRAIPARYPAVGPMAGRWREGSPVNGLIGAIGLG